MMAGENGADDELPLLERWMREVDYVIDDFLNKRLGNGDLYYGKRKSGFNGEAPGEAGRKAVPEVRDRTEDYRGGGWSDIRRMAKRVPDFRPLSGGTASDEAVQSSGDGGDAEGDNFGADQT